MCVSVVACLRLRRKVLLLPLQLDMLLGLALSGWGRGCCCSWDPGVCVVFDAAGAGEVSVAFCCWDRGKSWFSLLLFGYCGGQVSSGGGRAVVDDLLACQDFCCHAPLRLKE